MLNLHYLRPLTCCFCPYWDLGIRSSPHGSMWKAFLASQKRRLGQNHHQVQIACIYGAWPTHSVLVRLLHPHPTQALWTLFGGCSALAGGEARGPGERSSCQGHGAGPGRHVTTLSRPVYTPRPTERDLAEGGRVGAKMPPKPVTEGPAGVILWLINDNKHRPPTGFPVAGFFVLRAPWLFPALQKNSPAVVGTGP